LSNYGISIYWDTPSPVFPLPVIDQYGFFPTVFALLKEQKPESKLSFFYDWELMDSFYPVEVFERIQYIPDIPATIENITEYIKAEKPTLTFIYFSEPDITGHSVGWDTPGYYKKLSELDTNIGIIEEAVRDEGFYDDTIFIIVSDHGGQDKAHGAATLKVREIPLILYGPNIKKGYEITSFIMIYDIAPTIAVVLGLEYPSVWTGHPITEILLE
jgi:predicted AlkP superfamily pyrophosphatase or phosphodiesterase